MLIFYCMCWVRSANGRFILYIIHSVCGWAIAQLRRPEMDRRQLVGNNKFPSVFHLRLRVCEISGNRIFTAHFTCVLLSIYANGIDTWLLPLLSSSCVHTGDGHLWSKNKMALIIISADRWAIIGHSANIIIVCRFHRSIVYTLPLSPDRINVQLLAASHLQNNLKYERRHFEWERNEKNVRCVRLDARIEFVIMPYNINYIAWFGQTQFATRTLWQLTGLLTVCAVVIMLNVVVVVTLQCSSKHCVCRHAHNQRERERDFCRNAIRHWQTRRNWP